MEVFLQFVQHWLPLVQGLGALASVAGAMLSWRFALKAQRARDQMTRNMVASRLLSKLDSTLSYLKQARSELVSDDGNADVTAYKAKQQELKHLFETTVSAATAASPYLAQHTPGWGLLLETLARASISPMPGNVESAAKHLMLVSERIKVAAITRELQADHQ